MQDCLITNSGKRRRKKVLSIISADSTLKQRKEHLGRIIKEVVEMASEFLNLTDDIDILAEMLNEEKKRLVCSEGLSIEHADAIVNFITACLEVAALGTNHSKCFIEQLRNMDNQ